MAELHRSDWSLVLWQAPFRLLLVVIAAACFLSLSLPAPATASITLEGVLQEEVRDDFAARESVTTYSLKSGGETVPMQPTDLRFASGGDRVVAKGTMREGEFVGAVTRVTAEASTVAETGPRKVAVVLIKFPGDPVEPWPKSSTRARVLTANSFYQEESYGRISLTGKLDPDGDIFGWFTIKAPATECPYLTWRAEGRAAAEAAGVSFAGYDHIVFQSAPSSCGSGGIAQISGTEANVFGEIGPYVYIHELGHNLGLHHASSQTCTRNGIRVQISDSCIVNEYADPFDAMGSGNTRHNNSASLERLGALAPENIQTVTTDGIYTLKAALHPSLEPTTLRIPRATNPNGSLPSWYSLEIRERGGIFEDVSDRSMTGVSVRLIAPSAISAISLLIDSTPATSMISDAPLMTGNVFEDGTVRIRPLAAGNGRATVSIDFDYEPDTTPPTAPTQLAGYQPGTGWHSVALTWAPSSDDVVVNKYIVFRDGYEVGQTDDTEFLDSYMLLGEHVFTVYAQDAAGHRSTAADPLTITVLDEAPSAPTQLSVALNGTDASLSWLASVDDSGDPSYAVFRDGSEIGTSAITAFVDPEPTAGLHTYSVYALDQHGNRSQPSTPATLTILDKAPPTAPSKLFASQDGRDVLLTWAASTDDVGVVGYAIFRDGLAIGTSPTPSFLDQRPAPGQHAYEIYAQDAAGNRSQASAQKVVTVALVDLPAAPSSASAPASGQAPRSGSPPRRPKPQLHWHRLLDGTYRFRIDASADISVVRVTLWLDGRPLRARAGRTLQVSWDPRTAPGCDPVHSVVASAYDSNDKGRSTPSRLRISPWSLRKAGCRPEAQPRHKP